MVKEWWNKMRKGVKAGMAAFRESNQLTDTRVVKLIEEFRKSEVLRLAKEGEQYYKVENDIKSRKQQRIVEGKVIEESYKANNRIAHAKYKTQVDEKIAYLLSKPVTYRSDDEDYSKKVKEVLGKMFQHQLTELGYEASNKSIGWIHPYIDEKGEFKTMVIPFEQCVPVWKDKSHLELEEFIRVYQTYVWEYNEKKPVTNVEVWTEEGLTHYRLDGQQLIYDKEMSEDVYGPVSHYMHEDTWESWGKIPFIPFKNNWIELPDIKFVKSLLDAYDKDRSEVANYVEEVKNLIFVLKGYGGQDLDEFMHDLNRNRAIKIDDPEDGGVDTLNPSMDITAIQSHYEQLKRDLTEDGQSINKDLDKFGSAPSGIALKFMYSGLDLKCNLLESEFKIAFEMLLYFVDQYLVLTNQGDFTNVEMEIVFNRNMMVNETELIENCRNSKNIISDKTIIAHHPYTEDAEEEIEALKEQREAETHEWDKVPTMPEGGEGDEE